MEFMSNLENITQKILNDANDEVEKIKEITQTKIDEIIRPRIVEAEKVKEKILERAGLDAVSERDKVLSSAELSTRDNILRAKQEVMNKVFEISKGKLKDLSDEDYEKFIKDRLSQMKLKGGEKILIQEGRKIDKAFDGIELSEEKVSSGFAILDGKTLMNFNFDDLVEFNRHDLEGEIAKLLFDKE